MKRPSSADIEKMRRAGHAASTIREAELVQQIHDVFDGVKLGGGIGLLEGQALDDYAAADGRANTRARDEKEDWREIPPKLLNECDSSLSFFDAEGMRFHLPAFMIAEIEGTYYHGLAFRLGRYSDKRFSLLSKPQRAIVAAFIDHMIERGEVAYVNGEMEKARKEWRRDA